MMTTKDTKAQSSTTTPKLVRKPTVRHILQKPGSFVQSLMRGKGTQVPAEQRECRPYEYSRWPVGEYETQRGMAMEAMVMMVAVSVSLSPQLSV
jgi:hypothetical protein